MQRPSADEIRRSIAAHDSDTGLRDAAGLLARNPADPQVLALLDTLYDLMCDATSGQPNRPRATAALRRITITLHNAIHNGPETALAEEVYGKLSLADGLDETAVTALRRAETLGVPADRVDLPLALALLHGQRYQDVLEAAPSEPGSTPQHRALLMTVRARAYLGLSQIDAARQAFAAAVAIDPGNVEALSRLGMLALWQDHDDAAAAALLERTRELAPDGSATLRLAGEHDYATGDFRASAAAYAALVQRGAPETFDPTPPSLGAARALIYAGDLAAAQRALDASPLPAGNAALLYYRAMLAYRSGEFKKAADLAQSLEASLPDYPPLDLLLGAALLASDLPAMAAARLAHYVAEEPDDTVARALLDKAQHGITDPMAAVVSREELLVAFGFPLPAEAGTAGKGGS